MIPRMEGIRNDLENQGLVRYDRYSNKKTIVGTDPDSEYETAEEDIVESEQDESGGNLCEPES